MTRGIELQPVRLAVGEQTVGRLIFYEGWLVGVISRLTEVHGPDAGRWFLEVGFGPLDGLDHPVFEDLHVARQWVSEHLAGSALPQAASEPLE